MRALIDANNWASTPLGSPDAWPPALRTLVGIILSSPLPMALVWRPDAALIYNDAFAGLIGIRHPGALGRPVWDALGVPELEARFAELWSGGSAGSASLPLGLAEDRLAVHSPVPGEDGAAAGTWIVVPGTASGGESRDAFLLRLHDTLAPLADSAAMETAAARCLGERLGANRAFFLEIVDEQEAVVRHDYVSGVISMAGRYPIADFGPAFLTRLRQREVALFDDAFGLASSSMMIGLVEHGRVTAAFAAQSSLPRLWTNAEIELLGETARLTWTAIGRARAAVFATDIRLDGMRHWFRNVLQLIASTLNLQARDVDDSRLAGMLRKSRDRVYALGAVYEALSRSQGPAGVNLRPFAQVLVPELARLHDGAQRVEIRIEVESAMIQPERAAPLGLLLDELVSNVCAHAFPPGRRGEAEVRLKREGNVDVLTVADNGSGLPSHVAFDAPASLGLRLVHMLARQLGGEVKSIASSGARIEARFPAGEARPEDAR